MISFRHVWTTLLLFVCLCMSAAVQAQPEKLRLRQDDHVSIIGNTTADRMQHDSWLETYIHALHPELKLTFRNLAFPGDELKVRPREDNFGSPDEWLTKNQSDVVFAFFGYNEALKGPDGLDAFRKDLAEVIDGMLAQKYNGDTAPQIVMFSPIAHEDLDDPNLPNGSENNANLHLYTEAMRSVCETKKVAFVDLFNPTMELYAANEKPLTMNGIHLLPHGNKALASVITEALFDKKQPELSLPELLKLNEAVQQKNYYWFSRYRVVDGYNVFGGRSKLAWFGQSNADVMMREMEIFDVMTANRDKKVWAVASGKDYTVRDDNIPAELVVKSNKQGDKEDGSFSYLTPEETVKTFKLDEGLEANVFASEEMFPEMINPVQMAVDPDGRLFASVWPSYPHWNPTQPRRDRIVCLPDENGDGIADKCVIFADELNSVTGFEFWNGGMLVAALPELWFLKDTDGDDKADVKIRMLQGLSSADSHHSANAMVLGPDGWVYWSRGIFNVATMETPTKTYRSTQSGVHRFNPRTFEMEFHFPIGPNPHGDFFDAWGYQFANDGTSGTGSYVNIGKGVDNKKWFEKQWRPVAATMSLSSSHFPERFQNNFLVCNCIGFLGILQHEVHYNGADITAKAVTPLLDSSDSNFRPTDVEVGADGALYVSDWANALIGHMQHNMRDPNRDSRHGRIFRITATGRDLLKPVKLKGKPVDEVLEAFYAKENSVRYRARIELSSHDSDEIARRIPQWIKTKDVSKPEDAQALLECLWVLEEHRKPYRRLIETVAQAKEPRIRAAAIRTLGHWAGQISDWEPLLLAGARDESALVRAEAVKAAVNFTGLPAAEVIFEAATRELDPEMETVLSYAKSQINVDSLIQESIAANKPLSDAAYQYALKNAKVSDLLKLKRSAELYERVLNRSDIDATSMAESVIGLAALKNIKPAELLVDLISKGDAAGNTATLSGFGRLLSGQPASDLKSVQHHIETLALKGKTEVARQLGYATWIAAEGNGAAAFYAASKSKDSLKDLLAAVPQVASAELRSSLYGDVRTLMFELPPNLPAESSGSSLQEQGIQVDFFYPSADNVAVETLQKMTPQASGIVPEIVMEVPQLKQRDRFALRFTGNLTTPKSGKYTFFIKSDDGSRIYLDDKLLINHDGLHGFSEKKTDVELSAGAHSFVVTYFDNGGGDGLEVQWAGPGFRKQKIAREALSVGSRSNTIHDVAIRSLGAIPGNETELFNDLADLMKAGKHRTTAISVLANIPEQHWSAERIPGLVDNVIGYLSAIPAKFRTGGMAVTATELAKSLSTKLPDAAAKDALERLQNLDVRVIAIGTVPARMIYDKERIVVQAGKPVEFRFSNIDHMPHNFAIVQPGFMAEIGELAEATARDADAKDRHYVPASDKVLLASRLLEPGQKQDISYTAPETPGVYPYVCTYPGHWRRMFGAMYVVEDVEAYEADPAGYLAANKLETKDEMLSYLGRNTEWKLADLSDEVLHLEHRSNSFDVGEKLFTVASCIGCHKMNGKGANVGPDLTQLPPEYQPVDVLQHMLEPSKKIDKKYQAYTFVMTSGKVLVGQIVKEDGNNLHVLDNPTAPDKLRILNKDDIDEQEPSTVSIMPQGVLNKLTQEEILDLLAYVVSKGDRKSKLFSEHHH
ncbi:MAG: PA14 domain-containing protein [Planctomycetaceae bacterium]